MLSGSMTMHNLLSHQGRISNPNPIFTLKRGDFKIIPSREGII